MSGTRYGYRLRPWPNGGWTVERVGLEVGDMHPVASVATTTELLDVLTMELPNEAPDATGGPFAKDAARRMEGRPICPIGWDASEVKASAAAAGETGPEPVTARIARAAGED